MRIRRCQPGITEKPIGTHGALLIFVDQNIEGIYETFHKSGVTTRRKWFQHTNVSERDIENRGRYHRCQRTLSSNAQS